VTEVIDQEIDAIKAVLSALTPLSEKARASVLSYVTKRLSIQKSDDSEAFSEKELETEAKTITDKASGPPIHIKQLKEQKRPKSANEMAALVAYYLGNISAEKKETINYKDIEAYFKIAEFPVPGQARFTLVNAKNAGYLDSAGEGTYKLNAVGYNLIAHTLPRSGKPTPTHRPRARKKTSQKSKRSAKHV
jgi:hypothetical protein